MVLIIYDFSVSESRVVFVTLRTAYNAPRCHPNKGQLSVAIRSAVVPSKQGATFRCHSVRRGAVQIRGNFPLPFNAPRCRSNKGQLSVAMQFPSSKGQSSFESEVVHLESRKQEIECQSDVRITNEKGWGTLPGETGSRCTVQPRSRHNNRTRTYLKLYGFQTTKQKQKRKCRASEFVSTSVSSETAFRVYLFRFYQCSDVRVCLYLKLKIKSASSQNGDQVLSLSTIPYQRHLGYVRNEFLEDQLRRWKLEKVFEEHKGRSPSEKSGSPPLTS
ncbi:hypothetical protein HYC85_030827 [Camellia sinensis]|uniref:Uncharacterized protein n=1 Tax=Camellia sinensis TaxID=4442 RepID=A0A7J7G5T3_CAMSI|nr:hypothetical protein HYC85_030827 [Camellia sinensis]